MRLYVLLVTGTTAFCVLLLSQILLENVLESDQGPFTVPQTHKDYETIFKEVTQKVVIWWAPLRGSYDDGRVVQCGELSCYFTKDRHFRHHPLTKAFVFYGTSIKFRELPLPRNRSQLWALLHEESPRNVAPLSHTAVISLFNYTSTFSRFSSYPITTQYLRNLQVLTDQTYFISVEEKNKLQREESLAPVMFLQSDCSTTLDRDSYVVELEKHIKVDSYGKCLHNKNLPSNLQPPHSLETMMSEELLRLVGKYKFVLAIENGVCYDYITEKLWRPLISGSVPIYMGSPSVSDWLPNNKSAVIGSEFSSPGKLAKHLHQLNVNDKEYNSYLNHKLESKVTNKLLIHTLEEREWDIEEESEKGNFISKFECFVCKKVHETGDISVATRQHYDCPMPVSLVSRAPNTSNFWLDSWFYGRCEAETIRKFVDSGVEQWTQEMFKEALKELVIKKACQYSEV